MRDVYVRSAHKYAKTAVFLPAVEYEKKYNKSAIQKKKKSKGAVV